MLLLEHQVRFLLRGEAIYSLCAQNSLCRISKTHTNAVGIRAEFSIHENASYKKWEHSFIPILDRESQ